MLHLFVNLIQVYNVIIELNIFSIHVHTTTNIFPSIRSNKNFPLSYLWPYHPQQNWSYQSVWRLAIPISVGIYRSIFMPFWDKRDRLMRCSLLSKLDIWKRPVESVHTCSLQIPRSNFYCLFSSILTQEADTLENFWSLKQKFQNVIMYICYYFHS